MFLPQEFIRQKRDGHRLEPEDIRAFIEGLTRGTVGEGQAAAFAMAVFFRGMSHGECAALTRAMTDSGVILDWAGERLPGPVLDKHSTGGVGDKVSLILAPLIAACGGVVPMISGRGLGHTGGTADKLDAIPGYLTRPGLTRFRDAVREVGCAIIGQTDELAPADRRLYAIRDVTATVESIPLITASILSKKLASGLQGLVMDVKYGSGAFMRTEAEASRLAGSILAVAKEAGLPTRARLSDMNSVLGKSAGNALEVAEAIAHLKGEQRDPRLLEVVLMLASDMLMLGGLVRTAEEGRARAMRTLAEGSAALHFARMVAALGGPRDLLEHPHTHLPRAPHAIAVAPSRSGYIAGIDVRALGLAVVAVGGGRRRAQDEIDPAVGLDEVASLGEEVGKTRPLAILHTREAAPSAILAMVRDAFTIGDQKPPS